MEGKMSRAGVLVGAPGWWLRRKHMFEQGRYNKDCAMTDIYYMIK